MSQNLLIINRKPPWLGVSVHEIADIALSGGSLNLPISILFMDDGVFQILERDIPSAVGERDLSANLKSLPLFGVDQIFSCGYSLKSRGCISFKLILESIKILNLKEVRETIQSHHQVITI